MKDGIIIDSRERKSISSVSRHLTKHDVPFKVKKLKVGDYLICKSLPVERKTIADYVQSLYSGHLHKQYYELSKNYPLSIVGIIGSPIVQMYEEKHTIPMAAYISSIIGTLLKRAKDGQSGIIVPIQFATEYDFSLSLVYLYEKIIKGDLIRVPKIEKYKPKLNERKVFMISSIENVGEKNAKKLVKKFKTIKNISSLTEKELMQEKGIGEKIAKNIWNTLNN